MRMFILSARLSRPNPYRPWPIGVRRQERLVKDVPEPSPKLARPTMPTAPTGAIKKDIPAAKSGAAASFDETGAINDPALKPVTEDVPAFLPVTAGGAPLPSIKEFPEEKPAPAVSALLSVLRLGAALLIQSCFR